MSCYKGRCGANVWLTQQDMISDWLMDGLAEKLEIIEGVKCGCAARGSVCDLQCLYVRNGVLCVPGWTCDIIGNCRNRFPALKKENAHDFFRVGRGGGGIGEGLFAKEAFDQGSLLLPMHG